VAQVLEHLGFSKGKVTDEKGASGGWRYSLLDRDRRCFTLADVQEQQDTGARGGDGRRASLVRDLALYSLIRLGMIVVLTGLLTVFDVYWLVAALVAIILSMVLSGLVFAGLRQRVASGLAQRSARRRAQRERLRQELRADRDTQAG
jgi:hypothetical protein